jgi:hypothetical protein
MGIVESLNRDSGSLQMRSHSSFVIRHSTRIPSLILSYVFCILSLSTPVHGTYNLRSTPPSHVHDAPPPGTWIPGKATFPSHGATAPFRYSLFAASSFTYTFTS